MPYRKIRDTFVPRDAALWFYRQATQGRRQELLRSLSESGRVPLGILFYHRIADRHRTAWTMSRDDFRRQLDWLEENFQIISLAECQRRIRSSTNSQPAIAITFDDGYAENMEYALPELKRRGLPATYFVATHFVQSQEAFPHDAGLGLHLHPNTVGQIAEIAGQGFEIGAHTHRHTDMGSLWTAEEIEREILHGARLLESWTGRPVRYFSFPYGLPANTSQTAVDVLRDSGFSGFCTAYGAWNWPGSRGFHLRRIHADPGLQRLKNWLTLDPRKLRDHQTLPFTEWAAQSSPALEQTLGQPSP
jgi:peptidoglycan/xylan/chitin deacetylase (PgdA/CDA1 family)